MEQTRVQKLKNSEEGQAIVEFALVLPLLLTILCGIIDFGWLFYNQLNLDNASREAARQISVKCVNYEYDDVLDEATTIVKNYVLSKNTLPEAGGVNVIYLDESGNELPNTANLSANMVRVSVTSNMPILTFVLQAITRDDVKVLTASSTFKVETRATTTTTSEP